MATLTKAQQSVARQIIATGQARHAPRHVIRVAVGTALVEANLTNPSGGDRDSEGAFQQRPSAGWGTLAQVTNVDYAANKFYDKAIPLYNQGKRGGALAQAVQVSAFPGRYQPRVAEAGGILKSLGGAGGTPGAPVATKTVSRRVPVTLSPGSLTPSSLTPGTPSTSTPSTHIPGQPYGAQAATPLISATRTETTQVPVKGRGGAQVTETNNGVVGAAWAAAQHVEKFQLPYVWGGGHVAGKVPGPSHLSGYDCSGITRYVLQQAGIKVNAQVASDFMNFGKPGPGAITIFASPTHVFLGFRKPSGKMVYFGTSESNPGGGAGFIPSENTAGYSVRHIDVAGGALKSLLSGVHAPKVNLKKGVHTNAPRFSNSPILPNSPTARGRHG